MPRSSPSSPGARFLRRPSGRRRLVVHRLLALCLLAGAPALLCGCGASPVAKARKLIAIGMIDDAEIALKQQVQRNPSDAEAFLWLGNVAVLRLQRAIEQESVDAEARQSLETAFRDYAAAGKLKPQDPRPLRNMAMLCVAGGWSYPLRNELAEVLKARLSQRDAVGEVALLVAPCAGDLRDTVLALGDAWAAGWKPSKWVWPKLVRKAVEADGARTAQVLDPRGVRWPSDKSVELTPKVPVIPYASPEMAPGAISSPTPMRASSFPVLRVTGDSVVIATERTGTVAGFISEGYVQRSGGSVDTSSIHVLPDMPIYLDRDLSVPCPLPPGSQIRWVNRWVYMPQPGILAQFTYGIPDSSRASRTAVAIRPDVLGAADFALLERRLERVREPEGDDDSAAVVRATRPLGTDVLRRLMSGEVAIGSPLELLFISAGRFQIGIREVRFGKDGTARAELERELPGGKVTYVVEGGVVREVREEASVSGKGD
jgi:hypothetical protein